MIHPVHVDCDVLEEESNNCKTIIITKFGADYGKFDYNMFIGILLHI